jgi:PPOX class probable F420-dependent enzyme
VRGSPADLTAEALAFLTERHLATLTTLLPDGRPHVVPVGFTWHAGTLVARVITDRASRKARNLASGGPAVLAQVDGRRWITLDGTGVVSFDPDRVADAVARYAQRYKQPRVNPTRVVLEIAVTSVLGSAEFFNAPRATAGPPG